MKIVLLAFAALVLSVGSPAAQTYTNQASASIQATATVVPSLGVTSPEDNLLYTGATAGVVDVPVSYTGTDALLLHRMLVRYPSLSSVVVSIESDSEPVENLPLAQWCHSVAGPDEWDLSRPGAIMLDLAGIDDNLTSAGSNLVLTLIYSEN